MRGTRIQAALVTGTIAALSSSLALILCGKGERGRGLATHNGPSQWIYGTRAGYRRSLTLRHTGTGTLIHLVSSWWWACVQYEAFPPRAVAKSYVRQAGEAGLIATAAYVVDYHFVPERLQPGFDKHVSTVSLAAIYVAFGIGLAAGAILFERRR